MKRNLTCIVCPIGCQLSVTLENGVVTEVTGNTCPRGKTYAENELTHPVRTLTTTVTLTGSEEHRLPVKTDKPIPKETMLEAMEKIRNITVRIPVKCGDILFSDFI